MKKLVLALAFAALGTSAVMAADPAPRTYSKAPAALMAPTSAYNWSGFYVGVNAGGVFSRSSFDLTASPFFGAAAPFLSADGTARFNRTGFTGGAQAGYNWQSGAFVYGVEADISYIDVKSSGSITRATVPGLALGSTILKVQDRTG